MPTKPAVADAIKFQIFGLQDGVKPWANQFFFHWSIGGPINAADLLTVVTAVDTAWNANMPPVLVDEVTKETVVGTALDSSSAPVASFGSSTPGSLNVNGMGAGSAFIVSRQIARRYRGGHSRVYICGLDPSETNDHQDEFDPSVVAGIAARWVAVENAAATALTGVGKTDREAVSISYYDGFTNVLYPSGRYHAVPTLRVTPLIDPIVLYKGRTQIGSQRRRAQP